MPLAADLPPAFYAIAALVFGLLLGSFLNVVIYRVPRGESIVYPGSHCGACGAAVKPYDNIPLLSYALLGGRCRACKARISLVYPAVELLTGLLFLAVTLKSGPTWTALAEMAFVAVLVSLIFIDARHQLLPNVITYPALILAVTARILLAWLESGGLFRVYSFPPDVLWTMPYLHLLRAAFIGGLLIACAVPIFWLIDRMDEVLFGKYLDWTEPDSAQVTPEEAEVEDKTQRRHDRIVYGTMLLGLLLAAGWIALGLLTPSSPDTIYYRIAYPDLLYSGLGALVGGGIIWLLRALYFYTRGVEGMGLGDVKMMAVIGAFLGWQSAILVLILGSLLGSIVGIALARRSQQGLKTALPFGIFLGIGALVALFAGAPLINWYTGTWQ
jgi:leader peptidase (prepilin peptidase)/N-methyltransferase